MCPTAAIEAINPSDNELLKSSVEVLQNTQEAPVFICCQVHDQQKNTYDKSKVIEVACLGRLEETELIALMAFGAPSIDLVRADCSQCENKTGAKTIAKIQASLTTLLSAWDQPNTITVKDTLPDSVLLAGGDHQQGESAVGLSRRDFFKQIKTGAQNAAVDVASATVLAQPERPDIETQVIKVLRDGNLPHFIPSRRERMLSHLEKFGEPVLDTIETRLWGHVTIESDLCQSCRMCATFCPTGALSSFEDTDGTCGVEHYPADCVQCRLCQDTCSMDALTLSSTVPLRDLVEGKIIRYLMKKHAVVNVGKNPNYEMPARAVTELYGHTVQVRVR
jgi:ferredoxin